jgi:hypothetical protein
MDDFAYSKGNYCSSGGAGGQNFLFLKSENKHPYLKSINGNTTASDYINFVNALLNSDLIQSYIKPGKTGDTVSGPSPTPGIINIADAIEPDDAFGGIEANQFTCRLKADTVVLTMGYNHIFTRDLSFDVSARFVDPEVIDDSDITYQRTIIRASLLGRFQACDIL